MWRLAIVNHLAASPNPTDAEALIFSPGSASTSLTFPSRQEAFKFFDANGWEPVSGYIDTTLENVSFAFRRKENGPDEPPHPVVGGAGRATGKKVAKKLKKLGIEVGNG